MKCSLMIVLFLVISGLTVTAFPQAIGTPPYGSFGGGPFDVINLGNLNVHFSIPLFQRRGRVTSFYYNIGYDSSIWAPVTSSGVTTWTPAGGWGWQSQTDAATGYIPAPTTIQSTCRWFDGRFWHTENSYKYTYSGFVDPLGTFHSTPHLLVIVQSDNCGGGTGSVTKTASDGSGWTVTVPDGIVSSRSGVVWNVPVGSRSGAAKVTDTNGNQITTSNGTTFYDTLSSSVAALTITGNAPSPVKYTYTSPQNTQVFYTMNYLAYTVQTSFQATNSNGAIHEYGPLTNNLVSSIQLPDGSSYSFTYEQTPGSCTPNPGTQSPCVTGRIHEVTLPSGGTIIYTYTDGFNGIESDGTTAGLTRSLSPSTSCNSPTGCWKYDRAQQGTGKLWKTTITDPNSNQTVINFSQDSATPNPTPNFYETQRQVYQGNATGTPLFVQQTCYNTNFTTCDTASVSTPISQVDTFRSISNGTNPNKISASEIVYGSNGYGLVTDVKDYDYGVVLGAAPASSLLLREAVTSYYAVGNGVYDHPDTVTIKNGQGQIKSQTIYRYDQTTVSGTTNTPQHVSVSPFRGNLTTIYSLGSTLTQTFTYFDTGNVSTATDMNGAVTTYTYGACGNSFLTETQSSVNSLTSYLTWDSNCAGGVVASSKDFNQNTTTYQYNDSNFWRLTKATFPDGGSTSITYNDGTASPWNIQTTSAKDSTTNVISESVLDGFGRVAKQELTSDPSGTDEADTTYDAIGRVASVSNPHRTASNPTDGITQYTYDPLNRITAIIHPDNSQISYSYAGAATQMQDEGSNSGGTSHVTKIYQVDGLGRTTSVCEVSSAMLKGNAGAPAACGLDLSATGFLTTYQHDALGNITSVAQPGVNSRTFTFDGLSRLTQEVNPESGTTTYTYDVAGQQGDLATRTRPQQNQTGAATTVTTYTFDKLHRLTGKSYNDGSTPSVTLSYDQATVGSYSPANPKGHLTNAVVGSNVASTIFGYDTMGRIAQEWQCTPLNCGSSTFSIGYQYDYLGDVTQVANGKEGVTYTYSYDAAAHLTKIVSSLSDSNHPATLLTLNSTSGYNPLGEVTQATLGNSIVRTINYDNRGRATSVTDGSIYNFTLGLANNSNVLTGTDSVNGNWTYTYDDMARLSTASKTGNALNFQYDPVANRWQQNATVGSGQQPQYTFDGNNHIQGAISGCSPTANYCYDSAGNLLNDSFYQYKYDAEGRMTNVLTTSGTNISTYTYDALGHRVRTVGSQTTDFIFDAAGRAVDQVSGSTWQRGEIFTGGMHLGTYNNLVNPATTYFEHSDWTGTVRARSSAAGASVETCTSLPFGDSQTCTGTDGSPAHFAEMSWEPESNLQHALFRQYNTTEGRWTVQDPAGLAAVDPSNPQTWNRYSYVMNNPTTFADPQGLFKCALTDSGMPFPGCYNDPNDPWVSGGGAGGASADSFFFFSIQGGWFPCTDFMPCGLPPLGPSPLQVLGQILSGNLAGALQSLGVIPTDGVDCQTGICVVNPIMDATQCPRSPMRYTIDSIPPSATTCGDYICDPRGNKIGIAPREALGMSEDVSVELGIAGIASGSASMVLNPLEWFGKGTWLNSGPYWRIGFSRLGGDKVFRLFIKGLGKLDFWNCGPL